MDHNHLPSINVSNDFTGTLLAMLKLQIFVDPGDKMVFECSLNKLMK